MFDSYFDDVFFTLIITIILPMAVGLPIFFWWRWYNDQQQFTANTRLNDARPRSMELLPISFEAERHIKEGWKFHRQGAYDTALTHYEKSFTVETANLPAIMQIALAHLDKGEIEDGEASLQDMLDNPRHFNEETLLWAMVRILSHHKYHAVAMPYMQRLLEIDPTNEDYISHFQHMQTAVGSVF